MFSYKWISRIVKINLWWRQINQMVTSKEMLLGWSTRGIKIAGRNINNLRYADDTSYGRKWRGTKVPLRESETLGITEVMGLSLSKLQELVMDREAWQAADHQVGRDRNNWETELNWKRCLAGMGNGNFLWWSNTLYLDRNVGLFVKKIKNYIPKGCVF